MAKVAAQATLLPTSGSSGDRAADNLLIAALLGFCVLRLYVAGATGLADDEAYYRIWSLAPSLSYLDHPPMVAWFIGAGRAFLGDTTLGIRLVGPVCHLIGGLVLWRTALLLTDPQTARRSVWIMLAMPLLAVGGVIITPDTPSVLFAGLVLWALAELDRSQNANWWLAVGLFAGLGLLSKYTNLFVGASIIVWLFAVPGNAKWFRAPQLWIGGLIAAALASPVVIWNAEHGWASFTKQFGRVGRSAHHGFFPLEFVLAFVALASPIIAVLAVAGLVRVTRSAIAERKSSDVLLAAAMWPMLLYFAIHTLHDRVQGNWPAPLYPAFAICAAIALGTLVPDRWRKAAFLSALGVGFLFTGAIYAHALHPFLASRKDPIEQMRGWSALGDAVDAKRREAGAAWIATSSYATTGQMMFALKGRSEVAQLDQRLRYIFLPPLPEALLRQPALYVELKRRVDLDLLKSKFGKVEPLGTLTRANGTRKSATYMLFLVSDPPAPPL